MHRLFAQLRFGVAPSTLARWMEATNTFSFPVTRLNEGASRAIGSRYLNVQSLVGWASGRSCSRVRSCHGFRSCPETYCFAAAPRSRTRSPVPKTDSEINESRHNVASTENVENTGNTLLGRVFARWKCIDSPTARVRRERYRIRVCTYE